MTDDGNTSAQAKPQAPEPNPALLRLEMFVGEWTVEASVGGQSMELGQTTFGWLEGGAFLVQHSDAARTEFPSATMIIGRDDSSETYYMLYFDSREVSRIYHMSLSEGTWKLWREAPGFWQRFVGTFSDDGRSIRCHWEKSGDGTQWEHDFDLTYTKFR